MIKALDGAAALVAALAVGAAGAAGGHVRADELSVHDVVRTDVKRLDTTSLVRVARSARAASTWCGTPTQIDLTPNAVAGHPVHWVYAIPSDGTDGIASVGSTMQTDAEAIDAWWRTQDPTRVPRNDLAPLACGLQLDLTSMRIQLSSGQLTPLAGRFAAVFSALNTAGLRSPFTKYIVYYDGPVSEDDVCGQGGSDSSGFGLAVVYVRACPGVSTAVVAAHELLHTLGAVPFGAPNECETPNASHTCDDPGDIMNPFIDAAPLTAKVLDPGRDDYYGHASGWTDAQDARWLVQLDRQASLAVAITGPGSVAADVPGLQCGQSCTTTWNTDTRLVLSATPARGAKLARFGGACTGSVNCVVAVAPGASVSALFAPSTFRLTVRISGRGSVRSSAPGISCRPRCSARVSSYEPLRLTATPAKGWRLRMWTGGCRGSRRTCTVAMTAPASARALFVRE